MGPRTAYDVTNERFTWWGDSKSCLKVGDYGIISVLSLLFWNSYQRQNGIGNLGSIPGGVDGVI